MRELLATLYGGCLVGSSFSWPTRPDHYRGTTVGATMELILENLQQLRGFRDFIRADQMPPCDFYLADPGFIVEFDESQHFTAPRRVALSLYPPGLEVGFSIARWRDLCRRIDAKDNEPPDRDERRAWYDTLRDLVPTLHGFKPTVRIYADAYRWCSLSKDSEKDLAAFRSLLNVELNESTPHGRMTL